MPKSQFVTPKDIMALFGISYRSASARLHKIRAALGKNTGTQRVSGSGDLVSWDEFNAFYNLKP